MSIFGIILKINVNLIAYNELMLVFYEEINEIN